MIRIQFEMHELLCFHCLKDLQSFAENFDVSNKRVGTLNHFSTCPKLFY